MRLIKSIEVYLKAEKNKDSYCLSAIILSKETSKDSAFKIQWIENLTLFL